MLLDCIVIVLALLPPGCDAECSTCEQELLIASEASKSWVSGCVGIMAWVSAPIAWPWAATAW